MNAIPVKIEQRALFIAHDGMAKMPERTRVSHRPTTQIQELVAVAYGLHPDDMRSRDRTHHICWPRQIAMYLTRKITRRSLLSIARAFNMKDHTTVLHAVRLVERRIAESEDVREEVAALMGALTA